MCQSFIRTISIKVSKYEKKKANMVSILYKNNINHEENFEFKLSGGCQSFIRTISIKSKKIFRIIRGRQCQSFIRTISIKVSKYEKKKANMVSILYKNNINLTFLGTYIWDSDSVNPL